MTRLDKVTIGWKWLNETLNTIVMGVNARTVIQGAGIHIQETGTGMLVSLQVKPDTDDSDTDAANNPGGGGGSGDATNLTALTARVAALEAFLDNSNWRPVDVMDASCVRSTINVLTNPLTPAGPLAPPVPPAH